jgi:hypothetical protein
MASWTPSVVSPAAGAERVALGHRLVDDYLEVVRARCRRNTLWATAYDLKVFFTVVQPSQTSALASALHANELVVVEPRRRMVQRTDRTSTPTRRVQQRRRPHRRHRAMGRVLERQPEAVRLAQDRRTDHRQGPPRSGRPHPNQIRDAPLAREAHFSVEPPAPHSVAKSPIRRGRRWLRSDLSRQKSAPHRRSGRSGSERYRMVLVPVAVRCERSGSARTGGYNSIRSTSSASSPTRFRGTRSPHHADVAPGSRRPARRVTRSNRSSSGASDSSIHAWTAAVRRGRASFAQSRTDRSFVRSSTVSR